MARTVGFWLLREDHSLASVMPDHPRVQGRNRWRPNSRSARITPVSFDSTSKAPNGEIIAASQGYETKASAEKGIQAIKTHAPNAKVEDHSETRSS
jgi:uncharacterized protein YegP (UPF0339 family)